jgi:hypothetical protein
MTVLKKSLASIASVAFVLLPGILILATTPRPASATVQFATDTGKACGACHVSAKGGGKLTPYGVKFQANGNKSPS